MTQETETFLAALAGALAGDLPEDERLIMCGFEGDPENAGPAAWRPRPWRPGREIVLNETANGYVTVGSFRRAGDGSFRRRTETFASGLALMVDDVGTKVPMEKMMRHDGFGPVPIVAPSAIVETSPGNYQWWYFLRTPERDMARFDGVIRAFISGKLLGADPGMSGVTRVGRIPGFTNGKAKWRTDDSPRGWVVKTTALAPDVRYTTGELLEAFDLKINGQRVIREQLHSSEAIERNRMFATAFKFLDGRGMLKKAEPDPSGWTEMRCPWVDGHTNGADTGAAVREPAAENDYYGAFRCHHGHCADRGWAELTEWINDLATEELEQANQTEHK